jgi:YHS domain-containing protein
MELQELHGTAHKLGLDYPWDTPTVIVRAMAKTEYKGTSYYFCTPKCHQAFTANPQKYVKAALSRKKSKSAFGPVEAPADERYRVIAEAAYYRAEHRGFAPGAELDDWLSAEAELDKLLGKR